MQDEHGPPVIAAVHEHSDHNERLEAASRLSVSAVEAVRDEVRRILASPRFSSSHRCQTLLSHVVSNALLGKEELLKERSIGSAVFGRNAAYDTNSDAVVRIAASEVRKKLAQYYFDAGSKSTVRIGLPPGSYVPVFSWLESPTQAVEEAGPKDHEDVEGSLKKLPAVSDATQSATPFLRKPIWLVGAGCALVICALLLLAHSLTAAPTGFDGFWGPVIGSRNPVLVCVGHRMLAWSEYDSDGTHAAAVAKAAQESNRKNRPVILLSDALTMSNITALLRGKEKAFSVRGQASTTFSDLQKGPVVLIGAFNNKWAIKLMEPMRFHLARDPDGSKEWIVDQQKPEARIGLVRIDADDFTNEDYALVARTLDPQTKEPTVILAGVTATATHAAGEFITNPLYLNDFAAQFPSNWQNKNIELLIVTKNVSGESGPPKVMESYFW